MREEKAGEGVGISGIHWYLERGKERKGAIGMRSMKKRGGDC